jgi:hypothetical protein
MDAGAMFFVMLGSLLIGAGGLLVGGARIFRKPRSLAQQLPSQPVSTCTWRMRFSYAPVLLERPILDAMRRGVSVHVQQAEVSGTDGWIEAELTGVAGAIEDALDSARRSGIQVQRHLAQQPLVGRAA